MQVHQKPLLRVPKIGGRLATGGDWDDTETHISGQSAAATGQRNSIQME